MAFMVFGSCLAKAQQPLDSTKVYRVGTKDGNEFVGMVKHQTDSLLQISTKKYGVVSIKLIEVDKISEVDEAHLKDGRVWKDNPQDARYFWAANGYGLSKGEGYYQNTWVLFNQVSYGFTDYFSCGVGIIPTFFFGGDEVPMWLTPKFSIPLKKEKVNLGIGTLIAFVPGTDSGTLGLLYGTLTAGSRNHNVSLGIAYGFANGETSSVPLVHVGGLTRVGANSYLMTESYFVSSDNELGGLMMFGGRQMVRRVGIDYGLMLPVGAGNDEFIAVPWLGITVSF